MSTCVCKSLRASAAEDLNEQRNLDHYRFAIWNERSGGSDDTVTALAMAGFIDPKPVGIVGDWLAVPVRLENNAQLAAFFANSVGDLVKNTTRDSRRYILPTSSLYAESIVGACCACEDGMMERERLELDRLRVDNEVLMLETKRLQARIDHKPALLDKEMPAPSRVELSVTAAGQ